MLEGIAAPTCVFAAQVTLVLMVWARITPPSVGPASLPDLAPLEPITLARSHGYPLHKAVSFPTAGASIGRHQEIPEYASRKHAASVANLEDHASTCRRSQDLSQRAYVLGRSRDWFLDCAELAPLHSMPKTFRSQKALYDRNREWWHFLHWVVSGIG